MSSQLVRHLCGAEIGWYLLNLTNIQFLSSFFVIVVSPQLMNGPSASHEHPSIPRISSVFLALNLRVDISYSLTELHSTLHIGPIQ